MQKGTECYSLRFCKKVGLCVLIVVRFSGLSNDLS